MAHSNLIFNNGEQNPNVESADFQRLQDLIFKGDFTIAASPNVTSVHPTTPAAWTNTVTFTARNAAGDIYRGYNGTGYTVGATPSAGAITLTPSGVANVNFVNGVATVLVAGNAASSVAGANTVVITAKAVNGVTPSGAGLTWTRTFT